MTTHATFNPIGSSNPKDLIDNAENLDWLILGPALLYPDRRSVNRLSWAGIEASFAAAQAQRESEFDADQAERVVDFNHFLSSSGYETPVDYAPGISITRTTQQVRYLSELYRPKDNAIPFTTTTFPADAAKWISNGDNSLRQETANSADPLKGSAMLGRGVVAIDGVVALLTQPQRADLRFQMRGFHAGSTYGGSLVYWNATMPRSQHNGGTIFSPTVPWNGSTATLAAFLAGTGETAPAASGCFCRLGKVDVDSFGAVGGAFNDVASFSKCHEAGWPIVLERPEYTISTLTTASVKDFELSSPRFSKLNVSGAIDVRYKTRLKLHNVNYDYTLQDSSQTNGFWARDCQELDVTRNTAANPWKTAFSFWSCRGGGIFRNTIRDTGRGGQSSGGVNLGCGVIVYGCNDVTVDHNFMEDIWQIPIFITGNDGYECWDIVVSKNILDRNEDNGIRVQSDDVARVMVHDISIEGNVVSFSKSDGIRYSGLRISVIANIVDGSLSSGIDCQFADSCLIASNIVRNCADGISMTAYDRMSDNNTITDNTIENCTGSSSAISIANVAGGSIGILRISSNTIKTLEVSGNCRGISVGMLEKTGTEDVVIEDNTINGFYLYGVTVTNLGKVAVSGQKFAASTSKTKDSYVSVTNCDVAVVTDNISRGPYGSDPAVAVRVGVTVASLILVNNILPHAVGAQAGTPTSGYSSGNVLGPVLAATYSISGAGIGGTNRTLTNTSTLLDVINVLYTMVDDIAKHRDIKR